MHKQLTVLNNIDFYYINLDYRTDRNEIFQKWCNNHDLNFKRFSAVEGSKIQELKYENIQGPVENSSDSVASDNIKAKAGYYGCTKSHHDLISNVINQNSNSEFVAIFEDDAIIEEKYMNDFYNILKNIPNDAGVIYLGGGHRIRKGYLPILSKDKNFSELSSCFSTFAIIYRKSILPGIKDFLKKDLELTKENDGVYIIDKAYSALHAFLALNETPAKKGLRIVCKEYKKSCLKNNISNYKWYGVNPFIVGNFEVNDKNNLSFSDINIGKIDYSDLLRVGLYTNCFNREKIKTLVSKIKQFKELNTNETMQKDLYTHLHKLSVTKNKSLEYNKLIKWLSI